MGYPVSGERVLGVEGGGTKTAWMVVERAGDRLVRMGGGLLPAANFRLASAARLRAIFHQLPRDIGRAGIFLAGCVTADDRRSLAALASQVWPDGKIVTGGDRESGMAAALGAGDGIVVNAGTGSSITGRRGARIEKAAGWGHILGDAGGGYHLAIQALRFLLREHDMWGGTTETGTAILRALALNNFDELVRWAQTADKMEVASLGPVVLGAAESGDAQMLAIVESSARLLAEYTHAVARRLASEVPEVKLIGGLFAHWPLYVAAFERGMTDLSPRAVIALADHPPEFGAALLAAGGAIAPQLEMRAEVATADEARAVAATEERNPRSSELEGMSARSIVELFVAEERFVEAALGHQTAELARAIEMVATALPAGGRMFYVGAGTSGRLGILDASEIPPTFGAPPDLFQGIIAGGVPALYRSIEGSEDDRAGGALALENRGAKSGDIVCGITASGRTPFALAALARAREIGARTILLTCNPARPRTQAFDVEIDLPTGAELLAGSTRLKAGTATKIALNIISTGAMVLMGKVLENLMVDLVASNDKLRDRATSLVATLANCGYADARARLVAKNWNVRAALGEEANGSALP